MREGVIRILNFFQQGAEFIKQTGKSASFGKAFQYRNGKVRLAHADRSCQKQALIDGRKFLRKLHRKANGLRLRRICGLVAIEMAIAVTSRHPNFAERIVWT